MPKLPRSFYLRPTVTVAKDLLGKYLVRKIGRKRLVGRIVEVEAYRQDDPASHSFRGRTRRNEVMFWKGGHLYVYFTYGMHYCCNVVTGRAGVGEAVLIRAVEPVEGVEVMIRNRGLTAEDQENGILTRGPARVCQAFGITREQNGVDLCGDEIFIAPGMARVPGGSYAAISSSTRIGIRNGTERRWRFYMQGNKFVSVNKSVRK